MKEIWTGMDRMNEMEIENALDDSGVIPDRQKSGCYLRPSSPSAVEIHQQLTETHFPQPLLCDLCALRG